MNKKETVKTIVELEAQLDSELGLLGGENCGHYQMRECGDRVDLGRFTEVKFVSEARIPDRRVAQARAVIARLFDKVVEVKKEKQYKDEKTGEFSMRVNFAHEKRADAQLRYDREEAEREFREAKQELERETERATEDAQREKRSKVSKLIDKLEHKREVAERKFARLSQRKEARS